MKNKTNYKFEFTLFYIIILFLISFFIIIKYNLSILSFILAYFLLVVLEVYIGFEVYKKIIKKEIILPILFYKNANQLMIKKPFQYFYLICLIFAFILLLFLIIFLPSVL